MDIKFNNPQLAFLHIYPQYSWHDTVVIVGNKLALSALATILNRVARTGKPGIIDRDNPEHIKLDEVTVDCCFVNDGEGFEIVVIPVEDSETWNRLPVPYTAEYIKPTKEEHKFLTNLLKNIIKRRST